jgi:menaquinone-dependent protoporphyrinogen oxidase
MPPPRVLVAYATRHESTAEIAAAIAAELIAAGCVATLDEARTVDRLDGFDAAVIGSALYLGRWDDAALELLRRERATLAAIPTWLFSSGPVGVGSATARPERLPQPEDVADLADEIGAHATTFGGRVDPDDDGLEARIMASAGLAGDWRDFGRIRAWARGIAADVLTRAEASDEATAGDEGGDQPR